ncbi:hypothetical protein BV898_19426 [Hypsibius exemplaris]|uniref:Uncharacterized protein n=1 Tax=Hypsibius exemplaris TaxID=2072580 RepID=A0A9X6RPR8_HYPEX|nr:hypothetical protein BV898_19426 [Hypsibius exemplaris]
MDPFACHATSQPQRGHTQTKSKAGLISSFTARFDVSLTGRWQKGNDGMQPRRVTMIALISQQTLLARHLCVHLLTRLCGKTRSNMAEKLKTVPTLTCPDPSIHRVCLPAWRTDLSSRDYTVVPSYHPGHGVSVV